MTDYVGVKAWRAKNKDKVAAQARRYRAKHPDKRSAIRRRYVEKNIESVRAKGAERARSRRANDPVAQQARNRAFTERKRAMQEQLAGRPRPRACDVCATAAVGRIVWDHCHVKEEFRGWICDRCNKTLGMVKDDPGLLRLLAAYLES